MAGRRERVAIAAGLAARARVAVVAVASAAMMGGAGVAGVAETSAGAAGPAKVRVAATASMPGKSATVEPTSVADALNKIGDSGFARREAAGNYLLRQSSEALSQVEQRLARERDPEVVTRLTRVALHLFLKADTPLDGKASMLGIALDVEIVRLAEKHDEPRAAIVVNELQPGFPAAEVLRPGDRIVAVNGEPLPADFTIQEFQQFINGSKPGSKVKFDVIRGKEQVKLAVPLAGLKEAGVPFITEFMNGRMMRAEMYLSQLRTGAGESLSLPSERGVRFPPANSEEE